MNDSLTTIAILKSDLQSFKTQLNERQTMLLQYENMRLKTKVNILICREKQASSSNYREKESLQSNVRQLVYVKMNRIII